MLAQISPPKFCEKALTEETSIKITLSQSECENIELRAVRCPYCDFVIAMVYADAQGHFLAKCQKCKMVTPINLAYFRRMASHCRKMQIPFNIKI